MQDAFRAVSDKLASLSRSVNQVGEILEAINDISVVSITPAIEETYRQLDSTLRAKNVVLDRAQSISAVSEETSASAEEISASTEELSASTQEIAASAQELLNISRRLREQLEKFKV